MTTRAFCSGWSVVLSGVIPRIRILNGRGGRLSTITEARYCEVVLPLMVMAFFRHPATVTLHSNQQADFDGFLSPFGGGFHQCLYTEGKAQTVDVCRRNGTGDRRVIFHFRVPSTVSEPEDSNPSGRVCSCSLARNTTVTPAMLVFPSLSSTGVLFSSTLF